MSDAFSKWLEFVPIPDKSAETVAKGIYETWMCRNSLMDILVTDNGKEFKNKVMCTFKKKGRFTKSAGKWSFFFIAHMAPNY